MNPRKLLDFIGINQSIKPTNLSALALIFAASLALSACGGETKTTANNTQTTTAQEAQSPLKVLVFSKTTGFRHYSIPIGVATLGIIGSEYGFTTDATEDAAVFTDENLAQYDVMVWLNTTGIVLTEPSQRDAVERFMTNGGGFVGIHSAADTEYDWPFYEELVGARFKCHPLQQLGDIINEAPNHPSTSHLPATWQLFDEFYSFNESPRSDVKVLLSIDENSYLQNPNTSNLPDSPTFPEGVNGTMGDHPMSWCHKNLGGTAWYTALGHEGTTYLLPDYQRHIAEGVLIAGGRIKGECTSTQR